MSEYPKFFSLRAIREYPIAFAVFYLGGAVLASMILVHIFTL